MDPSVAPAAWKITMLLADNAQAVSGKLYILGGGWSITAPGAPSAIALKIEVPWGEANKRHKLTLSLMNSDGHVVQVQGPAGPQDFVITSEFEIGRPPGLVQGTPLDAPFAVNLGPLPLSGGRYEWRCSIEGQNIFESCAFTVLGNSVQQPPQQ